MSMAGTTRNCVCAKSVASPPTPTTLGRGISMAPHKKKALGARSRLEEAADIGASGEHRRAASLREKAMDQSGRRHRTSPYSQKKE
jgi:hypothetical protein